MSAREHERHADDVGAYLLGALPELEATAFERHAMGCSECRDEIERLRTAAEALPRSVQQFEAPAGLRRSLMKTVRAEARERPAADAPARARRRFALPGLAIGWPRLAGAAAALVLVGAAVGLGIDRGTRGGDGERVLTASVDGARLPGGSARLVVRDGSAAQLHVKRLPVLHGGRVYEVWIEHGGAVRPAGALFAVHSDGSGAAAIPRRLARGDRVMVTRERAGGVKRPSEAPLITVRA